MIPKTATAATMARKTTRILIIVFLGRAELSSIVASLGSPTRLLPMQVARDAPRPEFDEIIAKPADDAVDNWNSPKLIGVARVWAGSGWPTG
jgi:hypothetical protein